MWRVYYSSEGRIGRLTWLHPNALLIIAFIAVSALLQGLAVTLGGFQNILTKEISSINDTFSFEVKLAGKKLKEGYASTFTVSIFWIIIAMFSGFICLNSNKARDIGEGNSG